MTEIEKNIVSLIDQLKIPFCGQYVQDFEQKKKYYISQFANISISGIGPVFYIDKNGKIYTILQRRFKDNYQWWFPGGYVELPPSCATSQITTQDGDIKFPNFTEIKNATIEEYYRQAISQKDWQKAKKNANDANKTKEIFKKLQINWPEEIDFNWQSAWQREVLEETGINIDNFQNRVIIDFKCSSSLMLGAEKERICNIDGRFCSLLGALENAPSTSPDQETQELRWICLDEIFFDENQQNYIAHNYIVNLYTITLIEESLHKITSYFIKKNSLIHNKFNQDNICKFNDPQNIQSYILQKTDKFDIENLNNIKELLSFSFGELGIARNIYNHNGINFLRLFINASLFLQKNELLSQKNILDFNNFLSDNYYIKNINNHEFLQK